MTDDDACFLDFLIIYSFLSTTVCQRNKTQNEDKLHSLGIYLYISEIFVIGDQMVMKFMNV